jgi:pimeloyl-ACP methyl ester carboxylesterase
MPAGNRADSPDRRRRPDDLAYWQVVRARSVALMAALVGLLTAGAGDASAALEFCEGASQRQCALLSVPIDRSGAVPGTIKLRIERTRAKRAVRPPLFLIAGGPGQSATRTFDNETVEFMVGTERRSRDVVVVDLRGTGSSGALRCPSLEDDGILAPPPTAGARCAAALGPRRAFYTAADAADDLDAVREALGAPRIALYGASYGTHVAATYARRHPTRVERMVLDSVVDPGGVDPLYRSSMQAATRVARALCRGGACRRSTRDVAADLARLAARLERRPLRGYLVDRRGRRRPARIDAFGLFTVLVAGDLNLPLRASLPGSVRNALRGDPAPLLRDYRSAGATESVRFPPRYLSVAAYAAALCQESPFPWAPATPTGGRRAQAQLIVGALPAGTFAPFGARTALDSDLLSLCEAWPGGTAPTARPPLPDVPALLLAGDADLRTPVESARAIAAELPRSELMVVRHAGHGVLGGDPSDCPGRAFRRFLAGGSAGRCPAGLHFRPQDPVPLSLRSIDVGPGRAARARRTLAAVRMTVDDGATTLVFRTFDFLSDVLIDPSARVPDVLRAGALRRGNYSIRASGRLAMRGTSFVPGVWVSGSIRRFLAFRGRATARLRVSGPRAARGVLTLRKGVLSGRLGGRMVSSRYRLDITRIVGRGLGASADVSAGCATAAASAHPTTRRLCAKLR